MSEKIPFLDMFPDCASLRDSCGGLDKAEVLDVLIERESMTMQLHTWFARMPAPVERTNIEQLLAAQFRLRGVQIQAEYPAPEQKKEEKKAKARVLMGKPIPKRADITPMNELTLESGNVTLEGEVFAVNSREIAKYGSAVLSFDMTDSTSSVRVSRFLRSDDDQSIVGMIHEGMWLRVQGKINYSKYDEDMVLEPRNIVQGEKVIRPDNAPQKRVELHLHTRYSALDAISDPADLVARAAYWGHPAIAVTDHGVAQAFPDMWKASKKYGVKIIYGEEGYLVNDVDGTLAVHGQSDLPLILAPSALLEGIDIAEGTPLRVTGQLRSFNNRSGHGSRLVISTFAQSLEPCDGGHFNRILLAGVLCKQPTLRRTPLGRSICDMILAVNRRYGRADYLPCIAWGKVAAKIAEMQVGDRLTLEGRVQSRTYIKQTDAGSEERTAYEVSVMQLLDDEETELI